MQRNTVTVEEFFKGHGHELGMKLLTSDAGLSRIIREPTVNRPGLALTGFTEHFAFKRVQAIGNAEFGYLKALSPEVREERFRRVFGFRIPCFVFTRGFDPDADFLKHAEANQIPVFNTHHITMRFINLATLALEMMFAPRGIELGSMVDILGVGVVIRGESGIGKSECVLALIERGYSLVSDDATKVTLIDNHEVVGTSPEVTRDHMEVRGIGIINVAAMFGVKSIRRDKTVDLVVTLKLWDEVKDVDRLGMEQEMVKILGLEIPHIVIPVRPGRDLARLIEVAAFQTKLKKTGHNAAEELNTRLIARMRQAQKP
jgi:HPr kinase/phosphorylase